MAADSRSRATAALARLWRDRHVSLWLLGSAFAVLALVAMVLNDPTAWIGDNRFELYANPGRRLSRMSSLWDPSRGLGRIRADFWPGVTLSIATMRAVGLSIGTSEHLWHGALIASSGIGAASFLRQFMPRIGIAHVLCGLLYMFGPYSVGFLLPSNLYLNYALAPWIFVLFHRGIHAADPWRWAGGLGLLVFAAGNTEVAGLIYAFFYLIPIAVFAVHVDATTTWRRVWGYLVRFGLLATAVSAVAIFTTLVGAEVFDQNLRETEAADVLNGASSWAESWRGLGSWLIYHRDITGFSRPQALVYLSSVAAILASFLAPALAVAGVAFARQRARILYGSMMILGLVMMVGLYPLDDPTPYGRGLDWAYDTIPNVSILRNNYKAGSGMVLGVSSLAGIMAAQCLERVGRFRRSGTRRRDLIINCGTRLVALVSLLAAGALISQPYWKGELYNPAWKLEAVPEYVTDSTAWLDAQPVGSRVLVLPRAYRNGFRWGWTNDDVLDAFVARPHVVEVPIHLSRPIPADLITAIDRALIDRRYVQGEIQELAAILGVDLIMIRNDHDWQTWDQPRPADYDDLRNDPALKLATTFGEPGTNTTDAEDRSAEADRERLLPPIEVYEIIAGAQTAVRVTGPTPELLVSGDGEAIPLLASGGFLDDVSATTFTGDLSPDELVEAFERGSALVISDTNRRRVEQITTSAEQSYTLAAGQRLDRSPFQLFPADGAESVATYGEVATVRATGSVAFTGGLQPWHRPANALDGDPATTWLVGGLVDPVGERFRVDLVQPTDITGIRLLGAEPAGGLRGQARRLAGATIVFSDGTVAAAKLVDGQYRLDVRIEDLEWIDVTITDVDGIGLAPVGLAELSIVGVDSLERIAATNDVALAALDNPELAEALETATIVYAFSRAIGEGPVDEERRLSRSFTTLAQADLDVAGRLRVGVDVSEDVLSALAQTQVRARASDRLLGNPGFTGARAVDGILETGWVAAPNSGASIQLDFDRQPIEEIVVRTRIGQGLSAVRELTVSIGEHEIVTPLPNTSCAGTAQCAAVAVIPIPMLEASRAVVAVTAIGTTGQDGTNPVRIDEIELNGVANRTQAGESGQLSRCIANLLTINGSSVPVRLVGPVDLALRGVTLPFTGCNRVALEPGPTTLTSGPGIIMDTVFLVPPDGIGTVDPTANTVDVLAQTQTRWTLDVDAPEGGLLVLGQSFHPAWQATLDGEELGPPLSIDTFAAWRLPAGTAGTVVVEFSWQRWFEVSLAITLAGVGLCAWLVLRRPKR